MKKHQIFIKSLALILAAVMLSSIVACSGNQGNSQTTTAQAPDSSGNENTEASTEKGPDLPAVKYDGDEFVFLVRAANNEWDAIDIFAEADASDKVSDAILNRNLRIENEYDIVITQVNCHESKYLEKVTELGTAQDDSVDVFLGSQSALYPPAINGYLLNMETELHYNDFSANWWDSALNDELSLVNRQFYAVSSMNLMSYLATWVVAFNMQVLKDIGIDENAPYQNVRDGSWTLDTYSTYVKNYTRDINNDGKMTEADQWGTAGQSDHILGMLYGAGFSVLTKDADGDPVLSAPTERMLDAITKVALLCSKTVAFDSHDSSVNTLYSTDGEYGRTMFADNRAMFFHETLHSLNSMRDMNSNFGIVPVPKYDENQKNYISMVHYWALSATAVPVHLTNLDQISVILEAMAYDSYLNVVPTFLESAVYGKYLRDDASYEMMSYVNENRYLDLAIVTNIGSIMEVVKNGVYDASLNYSRIYDSAKKMVNTQLAEIIEAVSNS